MNITSTHWGCLVVQPYAHRRVSKSLAALDVEHFIPMVEVIRGHRRRRELHPLLGEYIPISITSIWRAVQRIRGVAGYLMNETDTPAPILPHELQRLRDACDGDVYRVATADKSGFYYGQKVTPVDGPFMHHVGRYDSATKRGESALFLLFGREQRVMFKRGALLAA